MINSSFNILEAEAWVDVMQSNEYAMTPMVANAATNVAGADIEGYVSQKFRTVNIATPVKPSAPVAYTGSDYTIDSPTLTEESLTIDKHYARGFKIDKVDSRFSMPDLVQRFMKPYYQGLLTQINSDVKAEAKKFEAVFADNNTDSTVFDDGDLRTARRIALERKLVDPASSQIAILDPYAEQDLTGLSIFHKANEFGSTSTLREGSIGRAFGYDFYLDNSGSSHTPATVTDAVVAAVAAIGATSITIDDGSGGAATVSLAEGDKVTFGSAKGVDDFYTVDSQTTTALVLKEPLRKALADNATINPVDIASGDTGKEIFMYDPSALALVTCALPDLDPSSSGVRLANGYDPINKVNYTISVQKTFKGVEIVMETVYGVKLFRPDLGVTYIRGNVAKA